MRGLLSLIALIAVSGCHHASIAASGGGSGSMVEHLLSTDSSHYTAGSTITLQLVNRTGRPIGYNLCRSRLERSDSEGDWRPALNSLGEVCTAELRTLRRGERATFALRVEPRLRRGNYRITTDLEHLQAGSRFVAVSNTFTITRDSE